MLCMSSAQHKRHSWAGWTASHRGGQVCLHLTSFSGDAWRFYGSNVMEPKSAGRSLGYSRRYKDARPKELSSLLVPEVVSVVCINTLQIISGLVKRHLLHPNRNMSCGDCVVLCHFKHIFIGMSDITFAITFTSHSFQLIT